MARIKKADPELLLVSFCDILTISISGLFMATIITVFEATKVPELSMVPKAAPTTKSAQFFECRHGEVFYVDKSTLDDQVHKLLAEINPAIQSKPADFLKLVASRDIGNEFYKVNPNYLLTAVVALEAREDVKGYDLPVIKAEKGKYQNLLAQIDYNKYYVVFLVRDDSFDVFRAARIVADKAGFDVGWELLAEGEPIKFGSGGQTIPTGG